MGHSPQSEPIGSQGHSGAQIPARPWALHAEKGYATVFDATANPVIGLTDVELGWTDTTTGPYRDPQSDLEELRAIVNEVNNSAEILTALCRAADALQHWGVIFNDARSARHRRFAEKMLSEAREALAIIAKVEGRAS